MFLCGGFAAGSAGHTAVLGANARAVVGAEDCGMPCAASGKAAAKKHPARRAGLHILRLRFTKPSSTLMPPCDTVASANVLRRICFILACAEQTPSYSRWKSMA